MKIDEEFWKGKFQKGHEMHGFSSLLGNEQGFFLTLLLASCAYVIGICLVSFKGFILRSFVSVCSPMLFCVNL